MNQYDDTSPKEPRQDTDMETNEYSRASVPVTNRKRRTVSSVEYLHMALKAM